jgi:hypothetical protein
MTVTKKQDTNICQGKLDTKPLLKNSEKQSPKEVPNEIDFNFYIR